MTKLNITELMAKTASENNVGLNQYYTYDSNDDLWSSGPNSTVTDGADFGYGQQPEEIAGDVGDVDVIDDGVFAPGAGIGTDTSGPSDDFFIPAEFEVDRRPMCWISLSNVNEYYNTRNDNGHPFRKTDSNDPNVDGVQDLVNRMQYHYDLGFRRFMIQSPAGNSLVNGVHGDVNNPFCYYSSNTWTGMSELNPVVIGDDIFEDRFYEKPWTDTGYPGLLSSSQHEYQMGFGDKHALLGVRQDSYRNFLAPWLASHTDVEFIPYGGIQVPFKADGSLDYGILANARRKGTEPYSKHIERFPMFNSSDLKHQEYFLTQMNGWSNATNGLIKSIGFDTGSDMHEAEPGEEYGDTPRWFLSHGFKPYGEAVAFDWSTGVPRYRDASVYRTAPYMGLYHGNNRKGAVPTEAHYDGFWDGTADWQQWRFNPNNTEVHIILNWYWMRTAGWTNSMVEETIQEMYDRGYVVSFSGTLRTQNTQTEEDAEFLSTLINLYRQN